MSIFTTLFSGSDTVGKVIDAVKDSGDVMFLTDEEEIQYNISQQKLKMEWMKLYEPFKIAQRYIALIVTIPYVSAWFITFLISMFNYPIDKQLELLKGDVGLAFALIVGFYFAAGATEGILDKFNKNKK